MLAMLTSSVYPWITLVLVICAAAGGVFWIGRRSGMLASTEHTDAQAAATQAEVIARQQAMDQAGINAPKDQQAEIDHLNKGEF